MASKDGDFVPETGGVDLADDHLRSDMEALRNLKDDDFVPVTGGVDLADDYLRGDMEALRNLKVESELDLHIVRLLRLHPNLKVGFRNQDLTRLDDETKKAFIQDMNDLLEINPLRSRRE
jgi:hypothetical protein